MRYTLFFFICFPYVLYAQKPSDTLTTVVCTAQAMPTDIRQAVHSVKVLDQKTIERRGASNLEELLSSETSFRFSSDLILGSGIQINGVGGENVKILIDGVPVIGRLNGNVDLSQIPLYNIQRVEIVQGALSSFYGSNASGGVINLITKKTQARPIELNVSSQLESVGIKSVSAKTGFRKGKFLMQLSGQSYSFSGYPVDSVRSSLWHPKKQQSGQALLKYYIKSNQSLALNYTLFDELVSNLGDIKRPTFKPYAFDSYYKTLRKDVNLSYEATFKKLTLQSTLGYNQFVRHKNSYRLDVETKEKLALEGEQDTSYFKALLWRSVFSYPLTSNIQLSGGTEAYYENAQGRKIVDSTETKLGYAKMSDYAAFLSTKITFFDKKLNLQPTFRYGYNSKYNAPISPSLNVLYHFNNAWSLRGGYARGFRAPSLKELYFNFIDINHYIIGSTNLKAEYSNNFTLTPSFSKQYNQTNLQVDPKSYYFSRICLVKISL
jgi:outer membrane receptor for ferrienterochelin and colicins